jgi:glutathione synthase/RimK-type ligase-like ATP-grasp enzyme
MCHPPNPNAPETAPTILPRQKNNRYVYDLATAFFCLLCKIFYAKFDGLILGEKAIVPIIYNLHNVSKKEDAQQPDEDENFLRSAMTLIDGYDPLARDAEKPDVFIPILGAAGGADKDPNTGLRRDSVPIAQAVVAYYDQQSNSTTTQSVVIQCLDEEEGQNEFAVRTNQAIYQFLSKRADGVIVRNNPGTLSPYTQTKIDSMLRRLSDEGVIIMSHPDVSQTLGAKDSLVKIKHLKSGLEDTEVYYDAQSFREGFMKSIAFQPRVIKQNRGSQGEGVWIVKLKDETAYCENYGDSVVSLDTELVLIEAYDNHIEYHTVAEFMEWCVNGRTDSSGTWTSTGRGQYFEGGEEARAMLVDQRFLPRIAEGEVRCLMVGEELIELVHKVPKDGGVSATLESGAIYTKYSPDHPKFAKLVENFKHDIPRLMSAFNFENQPLPLLWTADYISGETDDDFHVGEINCSCVGITRQLNVADIMAKVAVETVSKMRS